MVPVNGLDRHPRAGGRKPRGRPTAAGPGPQQAARAEPLTLRSLGRSGCQGSWQVKAPAMVVEFIPAPFAPSLRSRAMCRGDRHRLEGARAWLDALDGSNTLWAAGSTQETHNARVGSLLPGAMRRSQPRRSPSLKQEPLLTAPSKRRGTAAAGLGQPIRGLGALPLRDALMQ
jgi:hypothetical protein